jgi:hypothetical protein
MIEEYTPIAHLKPGTQYSQVFLVQNAFVKTTRKSKEPYMSVTLADPTGRIEGAIWNFSNTDVVKPGGYVSLEITTKLYKDTMQFNAKGRTTQPFVGTPENIDDYICGPGEAVLDYYSDELRSHIDGIDDIEYRDMLHSQVDIVDTLRNATFGETGSLSHPGGLLIHTVHAIRIALSSVEKCADINGLKVSKSLIVMGCLFRNIGWSTTMLLEGNFFRPRDAYFMTGIFRASARYVDHLMQSVESDLNVTLNESKKQSLHNMCAPVGDVRTLEGKVVAWAGDMASILHLGGYAMNLKQEGNWKGDFFVGHL